jgi:O-antigen/teichoic acid export membrane protein
MLGRFFCAKIPYMSVVSKNIFWLSISRVLALVLLFLAYTRLFRYLGPEVYGKYQFVLSYVLIFSTVVDFGIQQFITKQMSERPDQTKKLFHSFLVFEVLAAFVLYATLLIIASQNNYSREVTIAIAVTGAGMVANALCYPFLAVLTANQDLRKVALINFLNSIVNVGVIFLAIILQKNIIFLSSVQLTFGILDLVLYRIYITKHLSKPEVLNAVKDFDFGIIKNILKSGWPFVFLVGFSAIYNRVDMVIITKLRGFVDTGYYGAAYKMFDLLGFFPSVVSHTLFPFFASLMAKKAIGEVKVNLEKYLKLMILAALPIAVGGTILSRQLIILIAGPEYEPAASVLAILIWAPAILFVYIPVNSLVISQLTKKAMIVTGVNVLVNVIGNILLIPKYGIQAAAAMTVFSESIQGIFYFYFVRKNITHFSLSSLFVKPAIAVLIMGMALWQIKDLNLLISLPLGIAVYVVMLFVTRFVAWEDVKNFKQLMKPA